MKSTALTCAVAAAALGFGPLSFAQDVHRGDRDGRWGDRQAYASRDGSAGRWDSNGSWQNRQAPRQYERQRDQDRQGWQPQYSQQYRDNAYQRHGSYDAHRQYGQQGHWGARVPQYRRGDHVPYQYRQRPYYVTDWRAHRLYAPPQGYQWVRADDSGDFLLVAIASGLIANLLLSQ
jgi:Ni/Co efflux regulator RcnB